MPPRRTESDLKGAAEYGREAIGHWASAARFGVRALFAGKEAKRSAGKVEGSAGLLKGSSGSLKGRVGTRLLERLLPDAMADAVTGDGESERGDGRAEDGRAEDARAEDARAEAGDDHLFDNAAPMPIQESIDLAVPVAAVFDLCTRVEELPRFSERIGEVEVEDDTHFELAVKIGGRERSLPVEIVGQEPEERIDWECSDGFEHDGVVTFHPLAPRLTRLELTIEPESEGTVERLLRLAGVPDRAVRQELRRFKAYAELWDEANDYKSADFKDPASEEAEDEEPEDEEPEDEAPEDEEAEDEEPEDEAPEDEEPEDEAPEDELPEEPEDEEVPAEEPEDEEEELEQAA